MWRDSLGNLYRTHSEIRRAVRGKSLPATLRDEIIEALGFAPVTPAAQPDHNPLTEAVTEIDPVEVDGVWTQQWAVTPLDEARVETNKRAQIRALDAAAREYIDSEMHWVVGIVVRRKAQAGKPKSQAVEDWLQAVITTYLTRAQAVRNGTHDPAHLDFSSVGPCPYSMAEVLVE